MDRNFWLGKWQRNELGFHLGAPHPLLVAHVTALALPPGGRVFLPLCGKTRDIAWLLSRGYRVAGAELAKTAIEQLFAELGVAPGIAPAGALTRYSADGIDIFVGDVFDLSRELLGPVDAVYDRAALVALPADLRPRYAGHIAGLTGNAPQLLVTFTYDQSLVEGPPFSVDGAEVRRCYAGLYEAELLESVAMDDGLKGKYPAVEDVWLLR